MYFLYPKRKVFVCTFNETAVATHSFLLGTEVNRVLDALIISDYSYRNPGLHRYFEKRVHNVLQFFINERQDSSLINRELGQKLRKEVIADLQQSKRSESSKCSRQSSN